jgi:hypothetical protein
MKTATLRQLRHDFGSVFAAQRAKLDGHPRPWDGRGAGGEGASRVSRRGSRVDEPAAYHAEGILYLPAQARFDYLLNRPNAKLQDLRRTRDPPLPRLVLGQVNLGDN